jgi:hypothetical protein
MTNPFSYTKIVFIDPAVVLTMSYRQMKEYVKTRIIEAGFDIAKPYWCVDDSPTIWIWHQESDSNDR